MQGRRGWGFLAVWCALFAGLVFVHRVNAQTSCGWIACEEYVAANPGNGSGPYGLAHCAADENTAGHGLAGYIVKGMGGYSPHAGHWKGCNCAAKPPIPAGEMISLNEAGKKCVNGCRYVARGPTACWGPPNMPGGAQICDTAVYPDGNDCSPFGPDEPPQDPPPPPNCQTTVSPATGEAVETCITPNLPPPPQPPEICATRDGQDLGCVSPGDPCSGDADKGHLCAGNPDNPPEPPDEPEEPPEEPKEPPPPDEPKPDVCMTLETGSEVCIEIEINIHGPDQPPGEGPPPQRCWDGSMTTTGWCPAPNVGCPDGSAPVNDMCNTESTEPDPGEGGTESCPDGFSMVGGRCYRNCDDGSIPLNGQCPAGPGNGEDGWCPNGSRPVGDMCQIGSECDPATDPDQCEGPPDGNAGGGQTCAAPPFCSGDPILCQSLNQQWETRCAIENALGGDAPGDSDFGDNIDPGSAWGTQVIDGSELDDSGWFGGRECPDMGSVTFMDATYAISDWVPCDALAILSMLILLGAYVQAAYIILGRN